MPYTVPCERCATPITPGSRGTWQHAEGWIEYRGAGGANALALPERHPRFMCDPCMGLLRLGPSSDQISMFD
jgi:hypothetical protein